MSHTRVAPHCPYCAVQCGMDLVVDERGRVEVEARDFPVNRGGLCQKGGRHDDQPRGKSRPAAGSTGAASGAGTPTS
jgi:anaerobic selenocysteine-containing dehydrogenase